jgi:hypothetical protein
VNVNDEYYTHVHSVGSVGGKFIFSFRSRPNASKTRTGGGKKFHGHKILSTCMCTYLSRKALDPPPRRKSKVETTKINSK